MPKYEIELRQQAWKDLDALPVKDANRIYARIQRLQDGLIGDIKKLTNFAPSRRLRVGDFRVLFEIESTKIVVYRIRNRRDAYD